MSESLLRSAPALYRWRWAGLTALLAAEAMNLLDSTIVQVAGPRIHADLGGSVSDIQWFSAAYTLAFAVLLITGGRLGDIAGRKRVFRIGVTGFMLASLACALAPSAGTLIGFRAVQGAAAAVVIPQTFGLIRAMFDGDEMAKALSSIGPVMGLAAICGPVLGGVLTHADLFGSSWRAVFLVNLPLAAAVLAIAPKLAEDRAPQRPGLDPVGTALAMTGTGLIVYPLIQADPGHRPPWSWAAMALGLVVLLGFAVHQRHSARTGGRPLVEPSLFASRAFPAALVTSTLFFAVMNGLMLAVVLHMQLGLGTNTLTAGLTLLPWSMGLAISSWIAGAYLVPRYGSRVMYAGLAVLLIGVLAAIAAYHASDPTTYPRPLLAALTIAGLGIGLFTTPFFTAALRPVSPQETGSAAGLLNAVQQLGGTLGVAVLGSIYLDGARPGGHADALRAVQHAFWVAAALLVATAASTALMTAPHRHTGTAPASTPPPVTRPQPRSPDTDQPPAPQAADPQ
jgi:EmrB/QacA subfamily drug resistance transporter